jgi:hypothetical protein
MGNYSWGQARRLPYFSNGGIKKKSKTSTPDDYLANQVRISTWWREEVTKHQQGLNVAVQWARYAVRGDKKSDEHAMKSRKEVILAIAEQQTAGAAKAGC